MLQVSQHCTEQIEGMHANRIPWFHFWCISQTHDNEFTPIKHFQELMFFFPRIQKCELRWLQTTLSSAFTTEKKTLSLTDFLFLLLVNLEFVSPSFLPLTLSVGELNELWSDLDKSIRVRRKYNEGLVEFSKTLERAILLKENSKDLLSSVTKLWI